MSKQDDFIAFVKDSDQSPNTELSKSILASIKSELLPSRIIVLLKLISLQAFVGLLTMLFCPQFSMSLTNSHELFHYFHLTFGEHVCMAICGSIFVGSGAFASGLILTQGDMNRIRESRLLTYSLVSGLAVTLFTIFGTAVYIELAAIWTVASIIAGAVSIELGNWAKERMTRLVYTLGS